MPYKCQTGAIRVDKVKRTYRLGRDAVDKLEELARVEGTTVTDVLERAIRSYGTEPYASHTPGKAGQPAVEALSAELERLHGQLDAKDRQIETLGRALEAAQETAKAAQALHAMDGRRNALEDGAGRASRWRRLLEAWRGR